MIAANLDLIMFATMCAVIMVGFPVLFTLAGVAVIFGLIGYTFGIVDAARFLSVSGRIYGTITNTTLLAIPLFVFMGVVLERSKIAEELLESMSWVFGRMRGGLAISVTLVGALLAASTGIVGATVVTMGLMALPTMLRRGYNPRFACGSICAAGTLGQIIPPSTMLIILGVAMSTAYQQAQYASGVFSIQTLSIGQVFAGALLPGLMLVCLYIAYQLVRAWLVPGDAPPATSNPQDPEARQSMGRLLRSLIAPLALMVAVLGSILGGVATPTEAASVGGVGAIILAGLRISHRHSWVIVQGIVCLIGLIILAGIVDLRLGRPERPALDTAALAFSLVLVVGLSVSVLESLRRMWTTGVLGQAADSTLKINAMIFGIIIAATLFAMVFRALGGADRLEALLFAMPGGELGAIIFVMVLIFILGFVLEFVEITLIVIPIVGPVLLQMDFDPIWLSIMIAVNLQTSFQTPPFGFSLFYLRGAAPPSVRTIDIYRGVIPFLCIQVGALVVLYFVPGLATWLPNQLF